MFDFQFDEKAMLTGSTRMKVGACCAESNDSIRSSEWRIVSSMADFSGKRFSVVSFQRHGRGYIRRCFGVVCVMFCVSYIFYFPCVFVQVDDFVVDGFIDCVMQLHSVALFYSTTSSQSNPSTSTTPFCLIIQQQISSIR